MVSVQGHAQSLKSFEQSLQVGFKFALQLKCPHISDITHAQKNSDINMLAYPPTHRPPYDTYLISVDNY